MLRLELSPFSAPNPSRQSTFPQFANDLKSFVGVRPSLRMTKSAPEFDDENAPPTMSIMDSTPSAQDKIGSSSLMVRFFLLV